MSDGLAPHLNQSLFQSSIPWKTTNENIGHDQERLRFIRSVVVAREVYFEQVADLIRKRNSDVHVTSATAKGEIGCVSTAVIRGKETKCIILLVYFMFPKAGPSPESLHYGCFTFVPGRLDIENLIKTPMICSVPYFGLGGLVFCLGGLSATKSPVATGLSQRWRTMKSKC